MSPRRLPSLIAANKPAWCLAGLLVLFSILYLRTNGIYPVVMSDEYNYSKFSRLTDFSESTIPSYLYLLLYRITNVCGDQFLSCARFLNCLAFVAAAPFVYLAARTVTTRRLAVVIALLAIASPMNTVTAFYMPESLYFLGFWVVTWSILRHSGVATARTWCIDGALVGLLALVKPHGLFLLPSIVAYIAYLHWAARRARPGDLVANIAVFVATALATKFAGGFLIAGRAGLTFFGSTYAGYAGAGRTAAQLKPGYVLDVLTNLEGHLLATTCLFALPLGVLVFAAIRIVRAPRAVDGASRVNALALFVYGSLIPIACFFTISVAGLGPYETVARLHMRYYDFASPLLLMAVASQTTNDPDGRKTGWIRGLLALLIVGAVGYANAGGLSFYKASLIDNPLLQGFEHDSTWFVVLSGVSIACVLTWIWNRRVGGLLFLLAFMPLSVVVSGYYVNADLATRKVPDAYDKAAYVTKGILGSAEISGLTLIGPEPAAMFRTLFHLDRLGPALVVSASDAVHDFGTLEKGDRWALVFGDDVPPESRFRVERFDGFALVRSNRTRTVDFHVASWRGVVSMATGLYAPEGWGTWSSGDRVELTFASPLPERFTLRITAGAFGPNVGRPFVVHVGDQRESFVIGAVPEEKTLVFTNPTHASTVSIDVPMATSAKAAGVSADDTRLVGLGLVRLSVVDADAPDKAGEPR